MEIFFKGQFEELIDYQSRYKFRIKNISNELKEPKIPHSINFKCVIYKQNNNIYVITSIEKKILFFFTKYYDTFVLEFPCYILKSNNFLSTVYDIITTNEKKSFISDNYIIELRDIFNLDSFRLLSQKNNIQLYKDILPHNLIFKQFYCVKNLNK